jgi:streptomycin 6-kinase
VDTEDVGARLVGRFGPGAEEWLARVPALAARLASRWAWSSVSRSRAERPPSSCVVGGRTGPPAVLKLSPDRALSVKQVEMLRVFALSGRVPAVWSADAETGAMVLEEVLPGTVAEDLPRTSLPRRWADLLAALHAVAPPARRPWTLRDRCDEAFGRIGRRLSEPAIGARIDQAAWRRTVRRCAELPDTQTTRVLLHGDLPLGNVLDGGPARDLVAIDPKACVGDPCFDAVDYVVAGAGHEGVDPEPAIDELLALTR